MAARRGRRTERSDSATAGGAIGGPSETSHDAAATDALGATDSPAELAAWLADGVFGDTPKSAILDVICPQLSRHELAPQQTLFSKGEASKSVFVVAGGRLAVAIDAAAESGSPPPEIGPGEPVGELQALSAGARTATVFALEASSVVEIPRGALEQLAAEHPTALSRLARITSERLRRNQLARTLPTLFGPLTAEALAHVESVAQWTSMKRGEALFRQGDEADSVCIVVSGRLRATVSSVDGEERVVGEIHAGESVGEMAMFTGARRSATVTAVRNTELVRISNAEFERLTDAYPTVLRHLTRLTIERLDRLQTRKPTTELATTIAVIAAGPDVPVGEFCTRLTRALARCGTTAHLSAARIDTMLGTPGLTQLGPDAPGSLRVSCVIDEEEARHRFLVLEGAAGTDPWSERCVHEADHVMIVGRAADDPRPGEAERRLLDSGGSGGAALAASCLLVLLHPQGTRQPSGTRRWLEARNVARHHHVRDDDDSDVDRLARFVANQAVGVALGGGGARGLAHVGALRALDEAGIPVDAVGGTSMGAIVGSLYALGWAPPDISRVISGFFSGWQTDVTLPVVSLLGGHRTAKRLAEHIPDIAIEDLWLSFFCVSSNLTRAEMVVHRDGPVRSALRASAGVPGILPPVVADGDLLIDGGLLRNLPVDIMADLVAGGRVVAIDVSPVIDLAGNVSWGQSVSGWRIAWSRINPFGKRMSAPSMAAILQRSGEIASRAEERRVIQEMDGLYLRIPVEQFGMLDFKEAPSIVDAGYRHTTEHLKGWTHVRTGC